MATHSSNSCLENPTDRGAWWDTVHGVTKSQTRLSDTAHTYLSYGFPSHLGHHRVLNRVPCALHWVLISSLTHCINSVYMSIPVTQFIPTAPSPSLGVHTFLPYVCVSYFCFAKHFLCTIFLAFVILFACLDC